MSQSAMRLLSAARDIVGGMPQLALRLRTEQALLARYMIGDRPLPDPLLLSVLDIILVEREKLLRRVSTSEASRELF